MPMLSDNLPCNGGIIAPPIIIIINNEEPCVVYLPKPAIAKLNIQGHITLQNNPALMKEYKAISPEVNKPTIIIIVADKPKSINVLDGFSWAKKFAIINSTIQTE